MKIKWVFFFLFLFWLLGYFREFFFVNLNNIMYLKYYGHTTLPIPAVMSVFNSFSYGTLYFSKYFFTIIWMSLFFFINYFAVKKIATEKKLTRYLLYSYAVLLILAGISTAYGYFIKNRLSDDEYTISRWLFGIAQSPIICLILLASEKLYHKTNQT
ncbi:MAG TPA: hypothetical protein PL029_04245 [Bacteroidia bacterium]|nr:hypothetical protein [Bacteroidia bacterium]